jgi:hypothetical protein
MTASDAAVARVTDEIRYANVAKERFFLAGKRNRVRVHSGRSHPAVDLGLHGNRGNQRDRNGYCAQEEPEHSETFFVGHPQSPRSLMNVPPSPRRYNG